MRKTVSFASVLAVSLVVVAPANGASTRAEYIAQVEPICQSFAPQEATASSAFSRDYKRWARLLSHGTLKSWVRQTARTAAALRAFNNVHAAMTEQVAAVAPPPADASTITTWLNDRRQADVFSAAAASSFAHFKFPQFRKKLNQANAADAAGAQALSGFGFQVCGASA